MLEDKVDIFKIFLILRYYCNESLVIVLDT